MYAYMYVCMYVCMYAYIYIYKPATKYSAELGENGTGIPSEHGLQCQPLFFRIFYFSRHIPHTTQAERRAERGRHTSALFFFQANWFIKAPTPA